MSLKERVGYGLAASAVALGLLLVPTSSMEPGMADGRPESTHVVSTEKVVTLRLGDLEAVQDAAKYAQFCGGVLEIWGDGDLIVSGCDR